MWCRHPSPRRCWVLDQYDAVTFLNVFEQLPNPHAAERVLRDLVKPGGLLALETWDVDALVVRMSGMKWHKYRPDETPIYLNRQSLTTLFRPEEWTLVEYRARTKWITLAHGLHALGLAAHPTKNGGPPAARLARPDRAAFAAVSPGRSCLGGIEATRGPYRA